MNIERYNKMDLNEPITNWNFQRYIHFHFHIFFIFGQFLFHFFIRVPVPFFFNTIQISGNLFNKSKNVQ